VRRLLNRLLPTGRTFLAGSEKDAADRLIAEGNEAEKEGRLPEACRLYRQAVHAAPGYPKAHLNLGIGLEAARDTDAAIAAYEAALSIDSRDAPSNYNLARLLCARGDLTRAESLLRCALETKPEFPEALVVLSNVHDSQGNLAAAEAAIRKALGQRPEYAGAWYNLGDILGKSARLQEAETALRRAVEIDPRYADGWFRLGDVLSRLGRLEDAETALRRAIAADPASVPAHRLLGITLRKQFRIPEALELFAAARALAPESFAFEPMELYTLTSFDGISEEELSARHRAFGARLENAVAPRFEPFANEPDPERRLRIGYVSGDFRFHPVTLFLIPVLQRHDRSAYEIHCYSTNSDKDEVTPHVLAMSDAWRDCAKMSDMELADAINRDRIDVLVDLSGHTGIPCLNVFAQQPAPVQVTWLGYLNSTGLTRIRYRLCDAYTDPPGMTEHLHTETLVRLPHSQWCYRPFVLMGHADEPPMLRNGFVTFGSFNSPVKISETTHKLWCELLARLPDSRLTIVGVTEGRARERLLRSFGSAGIPASRITMVGRVALTEYFRWFDAVDIALDTTPYSGGTTTCDALWAGVPVVTAPGARPFSRSAASILSTAGLSEWIASTPEDYVRLAVEFARKEEVVIELRRSLRQRMRESPLMDEVQFARDLEGAYRRMWRAWCESTAP
jgi:protein O-GlcNAc transferase